MFRNKTNIKINTQNWKNLINGNSLTKIDTCSRQAENNTNCRIAQDLCQNKFFISSWLLKIFILFFSLQSWYNSRFMQCSSDELSLKNGQMKHATTYTTFAPFLNRVSLPATIVTCVCDSDKDRWDIRMAIQFATQRERLTSYC